MKNLLLAVLAVAAFAFLLKKCSPSRVQDSPFSGTWTVIRENETAGTKTAERVRIHTDGKRFRTEADAREDRFMAPPAEYKVTRFFDGETLFEKIVYAPSPDGAHATEPSEYSHKPTEAELHEIRFWRKAYTGEAGETETVAGRKARRYHAKVKLPDSVRSVDAWVDAETGAVLKAEIVLHSSQANTTVFRRTEEAVEFTPGPVDASLFRKP